MTYNFAYNGSVATFAMPNNGKAMLSPMSTVNAHDIRWAFFMPFFDNCINNIYGCLSCVMFLLFGEKAYYCLATREMTAVFLSKMPNNSKYMDSLVFQNNVGNDVTTSLIVAEVFGKEHNKVVRDIENLSCSPTFKAANFGVIEYIDSRGRTQKAYEMTKDGFSFLVMGYTGAKAGEFKERFINEFNRREAMLKNDDYILMRSQQILQKRIEAAEQRVKVLEAENQQKEAKITKLQPKADFADAAFRSDSKVDIGMSAKILRLGFGRNTLFKKLKEKGILFGNRNEPKQKYIDAGYFELTEKFIERDNHPGFVVTKVLVTQKGLAFINKLFGGSPSDGKLVPIR